MLMCAMVQTNILLAETGNEVRVGSSASYEDAIADPNVSKIILLNDIVLSSGEINITNPTPHTGDNYNFVVGASGSGKSTLHRSLSPLMRRGY